MMNPDLKPLFFRIVQKKINLTFNLCNFTFLDFSRTLKMNVYVRTWVVGSVTYFVKIVGSLQGTQEGQMSAQTLQVG